MIIIIKCIKCCRCASLGQKRAQVLNPNLDSCYLLTLSFIPVARCIYKRIDVWTVEQEKKKEGKAEDMRGMLTDRGTNCRHTIPTSCWRKLVADLDSASVSDLFDCFTRFYFPRTPLFLFFSFSRFSFFVSFLIFLSIYS